MASFPDAAAGLDQGIFEAIAPLAALAELRGGDEAHVAVAEGNVAAAVPLLAGVAGERALDVERLARHTANCEALAAAYARRRNRSLRLLRPDIDALLGETMAAELWEDGFDPDRFLDSLPAWGKRRYRLI